MRKKILFLTFVLILMFSVALINNATATDSYKGQVVKMEGLSTLYYVGLDGKRYVFPSAKTYFSWFDDFNDVVTISAEELMVMPLAGNVRYRPGGLLIKIQTDPKVYAVSNNGVLRWIKTEQLARGLYGANWNLLVDDIPDSFFTNYQIGDGVENEDEFDPDEEEEQTPSIDCNLGLKQKRIIKIITSKNKKRCNRLEKAIAKIQKRLTRSGIEVGELGEDYLDQCVDVASESQDTEDEDDTDSQDGKKIILCHIPPGNPDNAHTITVGKAAAKAHLARGDTIGACAGEESDDEDTASPVISGISTTTSTSTATITWTTDEEANSEVEYADESLSAADTTATILDETLITSHSVELTELTPATIYYFVIKSTDNSNNQATSTEMTFTTKEIEEPDTTAPIISDITAEAQITSATISWTTDEESTSFVEYATESLSTAASTDTVSESALVTNHSIDLISLTASTTYYFIVKSTDASDNTAVSDEDTFTTD